jgi:hypothetical protein
MDTALSLEIDRGVNIIEITQITEMRTTRRDTISRRRVLLSDSHLAILKHRPWGQDGLFCGADWSAYTGSYWVWKPNRQQRSQATTKTPRMLLVQC